MLAAIILLAAAMLTNKFQNLKIDLKDITKNFQWHTLKAGGAFGIISAGLLVLDGVLMLCWKRDDHINLDIHI